MNVGGRITSEEKSTISTYIGLIIVTVLGAWAIFFFFLAQEKQEEITGFDPKRRLPSDATLRRRLKPDQYFVAPDGGTATSFRDEFSNHERTCICVGIMSGE